MDTLATVLPVKTSKNACLEQIVAIKFRSAIIHLGASTGKWRKFFVGNLNIYLTPTRRWLVKVIFSSCDAGYDDRTGDCIDNDECLLETHGSYERMLLKINGDFHIRVSFYLQMSTSLFFLIEENGLNWQTNNCKNKINCTLKIE